MEQQQTVLALSDGKTTATVRPLDWPGWKEIKTILVRTIDNDKVKTAAALLMPWVFTGMEEFFTGVAGSGEAVGGNAEADRRLADSFDAPTMIEGIAEIVLNFDRLSDELVIRCVRLNPPNDDATMTAAEFMELRQMSFDVSDVFALVAQEKNFLVGLVSLAMLMQRQAASDDNEAQSVGGYSGNQRFTVPTDGAEGT